MHKLPLTAVLLTASTLSAQNLQDFYFRVMTGATTRGGAGVNFCQQISRFDAEDYVGWGNPVLATPPVTVSGYEITGCQYVMQDQNDGTVENYSVHFYGEDPTNPNFPSVLPTQLPGTNAIASFGPFPSATTGTNVISAFIYTINFTTPLVRPAGQDFFAALELPANAGWANTDGLSQHINLGVSPNFPPPTANTFDLRGPGLISGGLTNGSYGMAHDVTNQTMSYGGPRQFHWQFFVANGVGRGVVTAETNQASYTNSNAAPGTASFFSALHPDASAAPANGGRVDDINYVYFGAVPGDLIFYLLAFGFQTPELPLANLLPGSNGVVCLDLSTMVTASLNLAPSGTGQDAFRIAFTAGQRNLLIGLNLTLQGVAVNTTTLLATAGPCAWQRY